MAKVKYRPSDYEDVRRALLQLMKRNPDSASELEITIAKLNNLNQVVLANSVTGYHGGRERDIDIAEIEESRRKTPSQFNLYVAMLDIDNFGAFNKQYGEHVGNEVLGITTELLDQAIRDYDTLDERLDSKKCAGPTAKAYHLHGEEKQIIFDAPDDETAVKITERYRALVEAKSTELGSPETITESIGVTRFDYNDETFEEAQIRADKNMQLAKRNGRNQVCIANKDSDPAYFRDQNTLPNSR